MDITTLLIDPPPSTVILPEESVIAVEVELIEILAPSIGLDVSESTICIVLIILFNVIVWVAEVTTESRDILVFVL